MGINLGEDVASASLQVTGKTLEKLLELLAALIRTAKSTKGKVGSEKESSVKIGKNRMKKLMKSGDEIVPLGQSLTKEQMKLWSYYAKKYGVYFSASKDKKNNNERIIVIRKTDLERAVAVSEKVLETSKLKEFADKNKDNPEFVSKVMDGYCQDTYHDLNMKGIKFDEALNRITDRDFSREKPYFMVERNNPELYIKLQSSLDSFRGKEYTATDYTVYKDGKECGSFSDRRFEGRERDYWMKLKEEMKARGGFSDDVIILNSKEELESYRSSLREHNQQRSSKDRNYGLEVSNEGLREYQGLIAGLKERAKLDFIQDVSSGTMIAVSESEKRNIDKQITNYIKMEALQDSIDYNKSQYIMNSRRMDKGEADEKLLAVQSDLEKRIDADMVKMEDHYKIERDLKNEESMVVTNDILTGLYKEEVAKRWNEKDPELINKVAELGLNEESMLNNAGSLLDSETKRSMSERMNEIKAYRAGKENGTLGGNQKVVATPSLTDKTSLER